MNTSNEVILPNGSTLWWENNRAGGRTYYSDEIAGGVIVWDTCLVDESTLLAALTQEHTLRMKEYHATKTPPLDFWCKPGSVVRYVHFDVGTEAEKNRVGLYLAEHDCYTVADVVAYPDYREIFLQEFPNVGFDSRLFIAVDD